MIFDFIGNTPCFRIDELGNNIYLKYEGMNIFGSSKDRAAKYVLDKLLKNGSINSNTTIIESSSGNMGIALAALCKKYNLHFICVIDPNISTINEFILKSYGADIIKVTEKDENNSYLTKRIEKIKELQRSVKNCYWFNQYDNELLVEAYKNTIGKEICENVRNLDYVFVAVSSLGTIAGISQAVKELNINTKVIAVDVEGSKIFDRVTDKKRYVSGIGSNMKALNFYRALIDDKAIVDEKDGIYGCYELLNKHLVFAGGSSGCCFAAMKKYVNMNNLQNKNILCVFHDRGERYFNTIYSKEWIQENFGIEEVLE